MPRAHASLTLLALAASAHAGLGPENVAVVVNADSWASLTVANEFTQLRHIPAVNVILLNDLPDIEQISVDAFRKQILWPVLQTLRDRGISSQIDCIAYSADLPYAVDVSGDMAGGKFHKVITPTASINGLTYLYGYVLAKAALGYLDLGINRYARRPVGIDPGAPLPPDQRDAYLDAVKLGEAKKWPEAAAALQALLAKAPRSHELLYNTACVLAQGGKPDDAMKLLERLADAGWLDYARFSGDEDLASLRDRPDLKALVEKMRARPFDVQPTQGFRSAYGWSPDGKVVATEAPHYMLSVMLASTSGRGNSVEEAVAGLRRSASADGTSPAGTIYYVIRNEVRTQVRQWGFDAAIAKLGALGVKAQTVMADAAPQGLKDVQGAMMGVAGFDWGASGCTILPGAICEHLTSLGGVMVEDGGQTPLSEFLRYGAAGASGAVTEPYALQEKFPDPFIQVHYARGCTLAEAFYQSLRGPYQLLIVGDPLCRPWAKIPKVSVESIKPGDTVRGRIALKPAVEMPAGSELGHCELFVDGVRQAIIRPGDGFGADTRQMPDGYHEFRIVAVSADPIETQGEVTLPVQIDNTGRRLELALAERPDFPWGTQLHIAAKLPGADTISVFQNRRRLATLQGAEGQLVVDSRLLGTGPVRLHAVGVIGDAEYGLRVTSAPLDLKVLPPQSLPALPPPADAKWEPGLLLTREGQAPVVVPGTGNGNWLSDAKLPLGADFTLTGWFDVAADGVYQFQAHSAEEVRIAVDDAPPAALRPGVWGALPLSLAAGAHRVTIQAKAHVGHLKLRFGGPGALNLDAKRFRHPAP